MASETVLLKKDMQKRKAAEELDEAISMKGTRRRHPQGYVYDQNWADKHPNELTELRKEEEDRKKEKRREAAREKRQAQKLLKQSQAGPSTIVSEE
jgi:hypothetical protein